MGTGVSSSTTLATEGGSGKIGLTDEGDSVANPPARSVKEGTDRYSWSSAPTGDMRDPEPAPMLSYSFDASPITAWNGWPDSVSNRSIFYYLRQESSDPFSNFVKTWYKSSCAFVGQLLHPRRPGAPGVARVGRPVGPGPRGRV